MKPLSHVTDPRMVKALAHPVRVQILDALEDRVASPSQLAQQLGAPVANISYHVRKLEALGVLKLVREARRRGAIEHYFEIQTRPSIRGEAWKGTPEIVREAFLSALLGNISRQVNAAAAQGGFGTESHVSRLPLQLDEEAVRELGTAYERLVEEAREIEERSIARHAASDHDDTPRSLAVLMLFEEMDGAADGAAPDPGDHHPAAATTAAASDRS